MQPKMLRMQRNKIYSKLWASLRYYWQWKLSLRLLKNKQTTAGPDISVGTAFSPNPHCVALFSPFPYYFLFHHYHLFPVLAPRLRILAVSSDRRGDAYGWLIPSEPKSTKHFLLPFCITSFLITKGPDYSHCFSKTLPVPVLPPGTMFFKLLHSIYSLQLLSRGLRNREVWSLFRLTHAKVQTEISP